MEKCTYHNSAIDWEHYVTHSCSFLCRFVLCYISQFWYCVHFANAIIYCLFLFGCCCFWSVCVCVCWKCWCRFFFCYRRPSGPKSYYGIDCKWAKQTERKLKQTQFLHISGEIDSKYLLFTSAKYYKHLFRLHFWITSLCVYSVRSLRKIKRWGKLMSS